MCGHVYCVSPTAALTLPACPCPQAIEVSNERVRDILDGSCVLQMGWVCVRSTEQVSSDVFERTSQFVSQIMFQIVRSACLQLL